MPKSKQRGGQKAHNKRVKARNQKLNAERKKLQNAYTQMFQQKLEEFQNQYSGQTEEALTAEVVETPMEGSTIDTETTILTNEEN